MMDRDYPMTRGQQKVLAVGLLVMVLIGVALFAGLIPGLKPNYNAPSVVTYDGREYYYATERVPLPPILSNSSTPERLVFHNVTFWVWVSHWYSLTPGVLEGNVTLTNGSTYSFMLGGPPMLPTWVTSYVSPGHTAVVLWNNGLDFDLLVLAPSSESGP
ncbi:MAG TPA: hypothetical protein VEH57_04520 [Thermoplasmata archaeon]|nr:hypothetical protein [Thermoplasmata archaeon]